MKRTVALLAGLALAGALIAAAVAPAGAHTVRLVRWDVVKRSGHPPALVAGGSARATDPATGDTLTLTGTGQAEPRQRAAAGGGSFIHRHADGTSCCRGVYLVTGFVSFTQGPGSLAGTGILDAIGDREQATSGVLRVRVKLVHADGMVAEGTLTISGALPGAPAGSLEGVQLTVDGEHAFTQIRPGSHTLLHTLR